MKIYFFLTLLISSIAYGNIPNVVLLTSFDTPEVWYRSKDYSVNPKLESIFNKAFESTNYNVVVKHYVDEIQLIQELKNPDNMAIFFVSHMAGTGESDSVVEGTPSIVIDSKKDVKNLFQEFSPNLKFLALIGCNGADLVEAFKRKKIFKEELFNVVSFNKKVQPHTALKEALLQSENILGELKEVTKRKLNGKRPVQYKVPILKNESDKIGRFQNEYKCEKEFKGVDILITRTLDQDAPAAELIDSNEELIAFFPRGKKGEVQEVSAIIKDHQLTSERLKRIKIRKLSLLNLTQKSYLGSLSFYESTLDWKLRRKRSGDIAGTFENTYLLQAPLADILTEKITKNYCN